MVTTSGTLVNRFIVGVERDRPVARSRTEATAATSVDFVAACARLPGGYHSPQVRRPRRRCHIGSFNGDDRLHSAAAQSVLRSADGRSRRKMTDYGSASAPLMGTTSTR